MRDLLRAVRPVRRAPALAGVVMLMLALNSADRPPAAAATTLLSPRLIALQGDLQVGKSESLEAFWQEVSKQGAPLVEPIPGDDKNLLVTFVWRAVGETRNVAVIFGGGDQLASPHYFSQSLMENLPGSDLWYRTYRFRSDARYSYSISPNDALTLTPTVKPEDLAARMATLQPDPLNPKRYLNRSVLELPHAPPQPWIAAVPGVPTGKVEEHKFKSSILGNERSIWVYSPHGYAASDPPNHLVVMFDGDGELNPIAPVILDNLLARRRLPPVVMVMVGNAPDARLRELWHNDRFNEFLAKELLPWVRQRFRVTSNPQQTVVAGRSLGGNAAVYAGLKLPQIFGKVIAQSGGMMYRRTRPEMFVESHPGQFFEEGFVESEWLAREFVAQPKVNVKFYVEAGLAEDISWQPGVRFGYPSLLLATRHLRDVLRSKGYEVHYNEYNGAHEALSWRGTFADALIALIGKPDGRQGKSD